MRYPYALLIACLFMTVTSLKAQVAVCLDNVVVALPDDACTIDAEWQWINYGSYVPGADYLTYTLSGHRNLGPGAHTVTLTVRGFVGNTLVGQNSCWATVRVEDKTTPEVSCMDKTYYLLDPSDELTINVDDLVTITDNCTPISNINVPDWSGYDSRTFSAYAWNEGSSMVNACTGTITVADAEPQNYCSAYRNSSYEHIERVSITAGLAANSGDDGGYAWHRPSGQPTLYHGSNYTLSYRPGFRSSSYHEYWRVYLDKNGDGDFSDSGELLHQWNGYGGNSFNFNSPGAFWGWSRIRVVMSYGGYRGPCGGGGYGEVEDLSVYLRPSFIIIWPWGDALTAAEEVTTAALTSAADFGEERPNEAPAIGEMQRRNQALSPSQQAVNTTKKVSVFPNPASAGGRVTVAGLSEKSDLILRDMNGRVLGNYPVNDVLVKIDLPGNLPAGIYLLSQASGDWRERIIIR